MRSLEDLLRLGDPLLNFRWELTKYPNFPDVKFNPLSVEKVDISVMNFENYPIYINGSNNYYIGTGDTDPVSITFYENHHMSALRVLTYWRTLMFKDGFYGVPIDYKFDLELTIFALDSFSPTGVYSINGAWPASVDSVTYDGTSSERVSLTASFVCDSVTFSAQTYGELTDYGKNDIEIDKEKLRNSGLYMKNRDIITDMGNLEYKGYPYDPNKPPSLYFSFN